MMIISEYFTTIVTPDKGIKMEKNGKVINITNKIVNKILLEKKKAAFLI